MRRFMILSCIFAMSLIQCDRALADSCSASASLANYHPINNNKYFFVFNVNSDACRKYACGGYVHFAIHYHYPGPAPSVVVDRALVEYRIDQGQFQAHASVERYVGTSGTVVDDISVEDVTCSIR
jgi:hypothetical protein